MNEEIKDVVSTEVDEAVQATETPEVVEKPTKGSKGKKADKAGDKADKADKAEDGEKAVMANLNDWEAAPVKGRAPKKVEEHPNGITAYHY